MKDNKLKSKSKAGLFRQFLMSYCLLVVIVVLAISITFYSIIVNKLRSEVDALTLNNLSIVRDFMETKFAEMDRISYEIGNDINFMPYNLLGNGYSRAKAVGRLNSYCNANAYIGDLIVFYSNEVAESYNLESKFITSSGTFGSNIFFEYMYPFEFWTYSAFIEKIGNVVRSEIYYPTTLSSDGRNQNYLIYICPLGKIIGNTNQRGVVFFLIDQEEIDSMLKASLTEYGGTFRIFDDTGQVIYRLSYRDTSEKLEVPWKMSNECSELPVFQSVEFSEIQYTRIEMHSGTRHWSYVLDVPSNNYNSNIYAQIYPFLMWTPLVVVIGIMGSYVLSLHNYRPIGKLFDVFAQYSKRADMSLTGIAMTLKEMDQKNSNLQNRIRKQQDLCRLQFIQNLIHGRFHTEESLNNQKEECDIVFNGSHFVVMVILINHIDENSRDNSPAYIEEVKYAVINSIEEIYVSRGESAWGVSLGPDRGIAVVLCINPVKNMGMYFRKDGEKFLEFFRTHFNIGLTIGIGSLHKNPREIYLSYREALDAVSFQFVQGNNRIYMSDEMRDVYHKELQWYPEKEEKEIARLLIQGQYNPLQDKISKMFDNMKNSMMTSDIARSICIRLVNLVSATMKEMKLEIGETMTGKMDKMIAMRYPTMWNFMDEFLQFCFELCDIIVETRESKNYELKNKVEDYLKENYSDSNLTLTSIAECFGVSPSYLTRYFKNHTGISLMRYLNNIRMEHAKKLLISTPLSLDEIIENCGYIDKNNFVQKFKQYYGYTPIQYRDIKKQK